MKRYGGWPSRNKGKDGLPVERTFGTNCCRMLVGAGQLGLVGVAGGIRKQGTRDPLRLVWGRVTGVGRPLETGPAVVE